MARRAGRAWRRIAPFFRPSRWTIGLLAAASVAAGFTEAALLALVASVALALSQGQESLDASLGPVVVDASVGAVLGLCVGLAALRGALHVLLAYLPARMSANAMLHLRRRLFDAFTATSWSVQASQRDGHLQSLMNAHVTSTCQAIITLGTGVTAVLMFLTMLASAVAISVPTALAILVASAGLFLLLRPASRRLRGYARSLSAESLNYSKGVQEVVLMAEETRVFGVSDTYRQKFYGLVDEVRSPLLRTRFLSRALPALFQSLALLLLVLALVVVSTLGTSVIAALGAVVLILIRSLTYGQQIQSAVSGMDELLPFMHRLADAIQEYADNRQQDGEISLAHITDLGMEKVQYSYTSEKEVLHGIDFVARTGEAVGIVGPSGAGKSSMVQILLRLREPTHGTLRVNGRDAKDFRRVDWQQRVAYVPQQPQLVHGTVTDNIRFYRPGITDDDVRQAARRAHIHEDIVAWPDGYDTIIGQRASAVSGGQRQRMCLARALAAKPDVLILDEPTSALDVRSEVLVQESLSSLRGNVILFLVAHRLSTLSICDRVMVVVDGHLEAIDAPDRLLKTNAFYRDVTEITRRQSGV